MDDAQHRCIDNPNREDAGTDAGAATRVSAAGITAFAVAASQPRHSAERVRATPSELTIPSPSGRTSEFQPESSTAACLANRRKASLWQRLMLLTSYVMLIALFPGCTAFKPLHGIPVRQLPPELRGTSRANMETIDLRRLSQLPRAHHVDAGDLLGVYVYGILGKMDETPPVYVPQPGEGNPTIGLPIPVREDGTISLPQIPPLFVRGMTIREVEDAVRREYVSRGIRAEGTDILVSLQRSRSYRITVLRQETSNPQLTGLAGSGISLGSSKRGTGQIVTLKAGENDVLRALTISGGLPGLDAQNAIYVLRSPHPLLQPPPSARPVAFQSKSLPTVSKTRKTASKSPIVLTAGRGGRYDFANSSSGFEPAAATSGYSVPETTASNYSNTQEPIDLENGVAAPPQWEPNAYSATPPGPRGGRYGGAGFSNPNTESAMPAGNDSFPMPSTENRNSRSDGMNARRGPSVPAAEEFRQASQETPTIVAGGNTHIPPELQPYMSSGAQVFRIPIRLRPGEQTYLAENDILLFDGDILFIESRETEIFYTGGLLGGGQYSLPRDYDLDVVDAISIAQGRVASGPASGTGSHIGGIASTNQDISVSASRIIIIRRLPDGRRVNIKVDLNKALRDENENLLIQPGDHVILRYTPIEAIGAFIERNLLAGSLIGLATQTQGIGSSGGN